jgi:flagellar secretion chaperone FliS
MSMNPYLKLKSQLQTLEPSASWTRIDLLLALYDGALERLDRAEAALQTGDEFGAVSLICRVQLIICELASGVSLDVDPELGTNMVRLFEYCGHELRHPEITGIENARQILTTLREGFEAIRDEAVLLERNGQLSTADSQRMVFATA